MISTRPSRKPQRCRVPRLVLGWQSSSQSLKRRLTLYEIYISPKPSIDTQKLYPRMPFFTTAIFQKICQPSSPRHRPLLLLRLPNRGKSNPAARNPQMEPPTTSRRPVHPQHKSTSSHQQLPILVHIGPTSVPTLPAHGVAHGAKAPADFNTSSHQEAVPNTTR